MRKYSGKKTQLRKKRKSVTINKAVKLYVKKATAIKAENKMCATSNNYMPIVQAGINTILSTAVYNISPTIVQSVGVNGRIGNKVNLKSVYLRGCLQLANLISNSGIPAWPGQYLIRLFVGKLKDGIQSPSTAEMALLLRSGSSTYAFDSTVGLSLSRPVNKDYFTILSSKVYKIGISSIITGTQSVYGGINNNDYKLNHLIKMNLTKGFKKNLVFQEGVNNNQPINTSLFIWAGACDPLFSANGHQQDPVVALNYDIEYQYEDM